MDFTIAQSIRLLEVLDRDELTRLAHAVGGAIDSKNFEDFRNLYLETADAATPGGVVDGLDAIVEMVVRNHQDFETTQHHVGDVQVHLDGDTATVAANVIATMVPRAAEPEVNTSLGVRYRYDAVRTDEGWRFARVEIDLLWRR